MRHFALATCALGLAACASGGARDPNAAIARLEARRNANPASTTAIRSLGIAYYSAGRFPEARAALDSARLRDPKDGVAALYAGLTAEAQQDLPGAKAAYAAYLAVGKSAKTREQLRQRLAVVSREELTQSAKASLAAEATIGAAPGDPRTVAVPPFRFSGADTSLVPLERGLADLLVTDLARAPELTVLERDRMQAMVDEIALAQGNRMDEQTAVRAGRLLRAGRLVQGGITQLSPQALQLNAAVVDVAEARPVGAATGDDQLDALFELEKRLALQVLRALGVTLTPEQERAIAERPTQSFAAFLAYSRGLVAEDRGDFSGALRSYQEALRIDPGFLRAGVRQQQAASITQGAQVSATTVESSLKGTSEGAVASSAKQGEVASVSTASASASAVSATANNLNPSNGQNQTTASQPSTGGPSGSGTGSGSTTSSPPPTVTPTNPATTPPATTPARVTIVVPRP